MKQIPVSSYLIDSVEALAKDLSLSPVAVCNQAVYAWLKLSGVDVPVSLPMVLREVSGHHEGREIGGAPLNPPAPTANLDLRRQQAATAEHQSPHARPARERGEATAIGMMPTANAPNVEAPATRQHLMIIRDNELPVRVDVDRFLIGRAPQCDLVIASPRVSREHAVITWENGQYFLKDLGSSNGTWMSGERITRRPLTSGDSVVLGTEPLTFELKD